MSATAELRIGNLVIEGKTKKVFDIPNEVAHVLIESKDRITAGDGAKAHDLEGKAVISTDTTCTVFEFLNNVGIKSHFLRRHGDTGFVAKKCHMIPIEWVTRRIATGSFIRRHPGVPEGYRFAPIKQETFFKDDANHDPQWSNEQIISANFKYGNVTIGRNEVEIMNMTAACIFEILERAWNSLDCALIDMKVEFGISVTGEIVLADVIDSDSWRLWPSGDKRLMKDKQVYRNLQSVTPEDLAQVIKNFEWILQKLKGFLAVTSARTVVLMGSSVDLPLGEKVRREMRALGISCDIRISSAHKATEQTLQLIADYESDGIPTIFVAIAGRSNGLGPVIAGNTTYPVINCPPIAADWGAQDIWSSLRLPSGLGCCTVISPETAAISAAGMIALTDHSVWGRLRAKRLYAQVKLIESDNLATTVGSPSRFKSI